MVVVVWSAASYSSLLLTPFLLTHVAFGGQGCLTVLSGSSAILVILLLLLLPELYFLLTALPAEEIFVLCVCISLCVYVCVYRSLCDFY